MKKITNAQMGSIIYMLSLANGIGTTSNTLIGIAKQDAWISILIAAIIAFIPFFLIIKIIEYKPELNIFEKNNYLFGKIIGNIINILLILIFSFMAVSALWDLNNFISSQYLHLTPSLLIGIFMIITIIYMLTKDLIVIARTCFIMFIIGFILYLLGFLGLAWQINFDNIKPMFESGFVNILKGALISISYNILPVFLITVIPRDKMDIKNLNSLFIWFYLAGLVIFLIFFLIISIFGYNLASIYQYTPFHLLKNISLFGFINRIESTISIRWLFYLITFISMCLYFILQYIKNVFKIKNKTIINIIIVGLGLLTLYLSEIIFINNIIKEQFMLNYFPFFAFIILGFVPVVIFIFSKIKKAR